jgi:hypothetical protein
MYRKLQKNCTDNKTTMHYSCRTTHRTLSTVSQQCVARVQYDTSYRLNKTQKGQARHLQSTIFMLVLDRRGGAMCVSAKTGLRVKSRSLCLFWWWAKNREETGGRGYPLLVALLTALLPHTASNLTSRKKASLSRFLMKRITLTQIRRTGSG